MERTKLEYIKKLYGRNFLGLEQIKKVYNYDFEIPEIKYDLEILKKYNQTHILILGFELNIIDMVEMFGYKNNPCFYNQDWYLNEDFTKKKLEKSWYLIQRELNPNSRGKLPDIGNFNLPSAVLTTYTFFLNYLNNNEILWENDFVWNSDVDNFGDQIYTGRYNNGKNKNGFNIHRHLTIKNNYGAINLI